MSELRPVFTDIANAIRTKAGTTEKITPLDMPAAITNLPSGGSEPPAEALIITGDCDNWYSSTLNQWVFENYKNKMSTKDLDRGTGCFDSCPAEIIPFSINIKPQRTQTYFNSFFFNSNLSVAPEVNISFSQDMFQLGFLHFFGDCKNLIEIPERYFDTFHFENMKLSYKLGLDYFFSGTRIRKVPDLLEISKVQGKPDRTSIGMSDFASNTLVEEIDYPINDYLDYSSIGNTTPRMKSVTFDKNRKYYKDTPIKMKNRSIDFLGVGYAANSEVYFPGMKYITNDITYQQYKNDLDACAAFPEYSFYNHDSAVETINTLPDTSAYIASNGGTNNIKFGGDNGSKTDGGAISTLTEQEIAVAAAKGWTVSLV